MSSSGEAQAAGMMNDMADVDTRVADGDVWVLIDFLSEEERKMVPNRLATTDNKIHPKYTTNRHGTRCHNTVPHRTSNGRKSAYGVSRRYDI